MSQNVIDIFSADARKYAGRVRDALDPHSGGPDADAVRRAARRLHHSALLANQAPVLQATSAFQKVALQLIAGARRWHEWLTGAIGALIAELDAVVDALPAGDARAEARLREAADLLIVGVDEIVASSAEPAYLSHEATGAAAQPMDAADAELEALIVELGEAVQRLSNDPRDREPLKSMLRRIRRLRDLERIELLSPPDKALSAVEELILQIADLNATVGPGYLNVFKHAREALEKMRASPGGGAGATELGERVTEVDELKDEVIQRARRAPHIPWVSAMFFAEGPHIVACPLAEREAGSAEAYFLAEATQRLNRSESLRTQMLQSGTEQMRLTGESLSLTLRHLRERAAAFNHPDLGRVTRRAAAAVRAQLVRPPARLKALAAGFGDVFAALHKYLGSVDELDRAEAVREADAALHLAVLGDETETPMEGAHLDPDNAVQRALAIRRRVQARLERLVGSDADGLRQDLEELFDMISYYVSGSSGND